MAVACALVDVGLANDVCATETTKGDLQMSVSKLIEKAKTTNEILAYIHDLKGFAGLPSFAGGKQFGENLVSEGEKKYVSVEDLKQWLESPELLEELAELEHKQWIILMTFLRSLSKSRGSHVVQSKERWSQWKREANTPYSQLSESAKESDREFARLVLKKVLGLPLEGSK